LSETVFVDHFKAYNDYYGHLQGDDCLRKVATVIQQSCFRPEDLVARYGSEGFAVLLPYTESDKLARSPNEFPEI